MLAGKTPGANQPSSPVQVLDSVYVDSSKCQTYAEHTGPPLRWIYAAEASRLRKIEADWFKHFDAITVVSKAAAATCRTNVEHHDGLTVVGNGVDLEYLTPLPDPENHGDAFVEVLNYRPNVEGISWLVKHVIPRLRSQITDAKLTIVGRHCTPAVKPLGDGEGLEGTEPDVRTYLGQASVVNARLRMSRSVRNKLLEAKASRRAVVCSPAAAEGVNTTDRQHLLVDDRPEQSVDTIKICLLAAA